MESVKVATNNDALNEWNKFLVPLGNILCILPFSTKKPLTISRFRQTLFILIILALVLGDLYFTIMINLEPPPEVPPHRPDEEPPEPPPPASEEAVEIYSISTVIRGIVVRTYVGVSVLNAVFRLPEKVSQIHQVVQSVNNKIPVSWNHLRFAIMVLIGVTAGALECFIFQRMQGPQGFNNIYSSVISIYLHMLSVAGDVLYLTCCSLVSYYLKEIASMLDSLGQEVYSKQEILLIRTVNQQSFKIEEIRKLFGKICDMKDIVNDAFSPHLFVTAAMIFVDLIIFIFFCTSQMGNETTTLNWKTIGFMITWVALLLVKLLSLIKFSERIYSSMDTVAIEVHRVSNRNVDDRTKIEILAFSQEVLHRKQPITAGKFFTISYSMLPAMGSAISSYFIILLQFKGKASLPMVNYGGFAASGAFGPIFCIPPWNHSFYNQSS